VNCRAAVLLFFAPLAFGCLLGIAIANSLITALEDAQRERRERVTRVTTPYWRLPGSIESDAVRN